MTGRTGRRPDRTVRIVADGCRSPIMVSMSAGALINRADHRAAACSAPSRRAGRASPSGPALPGRAERWLRQTFATFHSKCCRSGNPLQGSPAAIASCRSFGTAVCPGRISGNQHRQPDLLSANRTAPVRRAATRCWQSRCVFQIPWMPAFQPPDRRSPPTPASEYHRPVFPSDREAAGQRREPRRILPELVTVQCKASASVCAVAGCS